MHKVSIIVPVYNAEKYLVKCLESICNQTLQDKEIICVNDCSTDGSLDILRQYEAQGKITLITMEQNGGESIARNTGIAAAQGEYIGFVDSDDWIDLDFYEKLYAEAAKEKVDIVKASLAYVFEDGQILPLTTNETIKRYQSKHLFCYEFYSAIYKTSFLKENNVAFPLGVRIGPDIAFLSDAIVHCQSYAIIDDTLYYYFQRSDSALNKPFSLQDVEALAAVRMKLIDNVKKSELDVTPYFDYLLSLHIRSFNELAFRAEEGPSRAFCVQTLLNLYEQALDKKALDVLIGQQFPLFAKALKIGDAKHLESFFAKKIHTKDEFFGKVLGKVKKFLPS